MLFVLNHLAGLPAVALPGFEEATPDTAQAVLEKPRTSPARCWPR